jgi:hypothetical protein
MKLSGYKARRLAMNISVEPLTSVKAVSEGLNKWRENASPNPNQATGTDPG